MKRSSAVGVALATLVVAMSAGAVDPRAGADADADWDPARVGRTVDAARAARAQGDLNAAERLCYSAFESVDASTQVAYDAYADRLQMLHRGDAEAVHAQAAKLHQLRTQHAASSAGTQPTSTYLGFVPSDGLKAYADLLQADQPSEAQRMRSLALAYQQVQQAHFQRTQLYRQGKDPRGAC